MRKRRFVSWNEPAPVPGELVAVNPSPGLRHQTKRKFELGRAEAAAAVPDRARAVNALHARRTTTAATADEQRCDRAGRGAAPGVTRGRGSRSSADGGEQRRRASSAPKTRPSRQRTCDDCPSLVTPGSENAIATTTPAGSAAATSVAALSTRSSVKHEPRRDHDDRRRGSRRASTSARARRSSRRRAASRRASAAARARAAARSRRAARAGSRARRARAAARARRPVVVVADGSTFPASDQTTTAPSRTQSPFASSRVRAASQSPSAANSEVDERAVGVVPRAVGQRRPRRSRARTRRRGRRAAAARAARRARPCAASSTSMTSSAPPPSHMSEPFPGPPPKKTARPARASGATSGSSRIARISREATIPGDVPGRSQKPYSAVVRSAFLVPLR